MKAPGSISPETANLLGVTIVKSALAVQVSTSFQVVPVSHLKKRRKGYRVDRVFKELPCVMRLNNGTVLVHPKLYDPMVKSFAATKGTAQ